MRKVNLETITDTIHRNLAILVKNYPGIMELLHLIDPRTHVISERAVRGIKEGTSAVLLQSGSDEKWRADSLACCCYLRNVQDLLADGKTLYEKRFGEPLKGPTRHGTSQGSTNLARTFFLECSSDMH